MAPPPLYLPITYLLGLLVWLIALGAACVWCLKFRRRRKQAKQSLFAPHFLLSTCCLLVMLSVAEVYCAFGVDQSDAFNMTNISKRWFYKYIEAQRNQMGFRDRHEFPRTLPDGMRRIAFFGDSFTIGHGIRRCEDRFSDRLQVALDRQEPGKFRVDNLGEPGLETSQIESRVKFLIDQGYQFDVVIYVFMLNDIEGYDPRTEEIIKSMQQKEPRFFLLTQTYFFNWLYFRWRQASGEGSDYFPHLKDSYNEAPWDGLRSKLVQLKRDCADNKVDFRMVIFPFLHNLGPGYPFHDAHQKLQEFCREEDIPVLDLEPVLEPHVSEGLTVNRFDAHPNERANAIVAEALEKSLLKNLFEKK
jgi:lysophospholipase L1-like esterase